MLIAMLHKPHHSQRGFSLVEMLIAVAVGLVVLAGITQIFATTVGSASDTRKMARVNADLRAAMDLMMRDIQRAGYYRCTFDAAPAGCPNPPLPSTQNPFTQGVNDLRVNNNVAGNVTGNCITFTYDRDSDGAVHDRDKAAFYLSNGAILMRNGGTGDSNSCSPSSAEGITDSNRVTITGLQFTVGSLPVVGTLAGEQCLDVTGGGTPTNCVTTAPNGNTWTKARQVTITIEGQPVEDVGVDKMKRTITDTVRIRNDLVCTKGSVQCP